MKDDVVGRMRDEMEALLSEESSGEEEEEDEDERDDYQNETQKKRQNLSHYWKDKGYHCESGIAIFAWRVLLDVQSL